uniref:Retrovirus-related Pol polyprotein from transposon TNT 1-94 n=1 Tax=Cajanus cajan TaxID=3821 RepID=A0A151TYS5_CAJCA|nr:Retrovirus-related Pol polyprotein from transposon TNT 1-94 [Cajanus cajan]
MVIFCDMHCLIVQKSNFQMIGAAKQWNGLFYLQDSSDLDSHESSLNHVSPSLNFSDVTTIDNSMLWHLRLGHTSNKVLKHLSSKYNDIVFYCLQPCDTCHYAKQKKLPFPVSNCKSSRFFELIHVDIWGPVATTSIDGFKYFLSVVDDFSRFTWIHLIKTKFDVKFMLPSFIQLIENQFTLKLQRIRSDNGKEFSLNDFFSTKGIFHETSCVETPQQNGIVERKHQHLLNVSRALLFQANLPTCFWSFAVRHATHLINRLPTPFLKLKTPYELVYGHAPVLNTLKIFGCLAYANTISSGRTKFDKRASKCIFLGFKAGTKGYILYNLQNKSFFISRNVIFYENNFPYATNSLQLPNIDTTSSITDTSQFDSLIQFDTTDSPIPT